MPLADGAGHTFLTGPGAHGSRSRNRVGYVFGLAGNRVLLAKIRHLAEDAAVARVAGSARLRREDVPDLGGLPEQRRPDARGRVARAPRPSGIGTSGIQSSGLNVFFIAAMD